MPKSCLDLYGFILVAFLPTGLFAQARAREDRKVFSPGHRYFLISNVAEHRTRIFRTGVPQTELWELPQYIPLPFLADDGQHLASAYEGGNILREDTKPGDPFLTFFNGPNHSTTVTVGQLFPRLDSLPQASSGRPWGLFSGFRGTHRFLLLLENSRKLELDADTGKPVR